VIDEVAVLKMGLFDKIPRPSIEQFTKRRQEWEISFPGAAQVIDLAE
jgi:hypothetical protein